MHERILSNVMKEYSSVKYRFLDDDAHSRFSSATCRTSGEVFYKEYIYFLKLLDYPVPAELSARSVYKPEMLIEPLTKYLNGGIMGKYNEMLYSRAVSRVMRAFFIGSVKPLSLEEVTYRSGTNSGAPLFMQKGDASHSAFKEARQILRGKCPPPLTVFHRGKNTEVVRPVFGYPMSMTLLESMYFQPLQVEYVRHHNPYVGGRTEPEIAGAINELRWKSNAIIELDYSGFDGSLSNRLIQSAFQVIENSLNLTDKERKMWNKIKIYFLTAPMLLPDGYMIKGRNHGVPSGSMFTQIVDSICNSIIIEYLKLRTGLMTSRYWVLGDDCVIGVINKSPSIKEIDYVLSELGISLNIKKSRITTVKEGQSVNFLGHDRSSFILRRPINETLIRLICPERVDLRYFGSVEDCKQALYERLRAYQLDNQNAWEILQKMINLITRGAMIAIRPSPEEWVFRPYQVHSERTRYDEEFNEFVIWPHYEQKARAVRALG